VGNARTVRPPAHSDRNSRFGTRGSSPSPAPRPLLTAGRSTQLLSARQLSGLPRKAVRRLWGRAPRIAQSTVFALRLPSWPQQFRRRAHSTELVESARDLWPVPSWPRHPLRDDDAARVTDQQRKEVGRVVVHRCRPSNSWGATRQTFQVSPAPGMGEALRLYHLSANGSARSQTKKAARLAAAVQSRARPTQLPPRWATPNVLSAATIRRVRRPVFLRELTE